MLTTPLTELLGCKHPVVCAPMCGFAMGAMAGAVAASGGVGLIGIGAGSIFGPERVEKEWSIAKESAQGGVLGFGLLQSFMSEGVSDPSFQKIVSLKPDCIWLSFGDSCPNELVDFIKKGSPKTVVLIQIFTPPEAVSASKVADALVVQGCDAGGHGRQDRTASLMTLVPQIKSDLKKAGRDIPVVATGGVFSGAGLAASLALGADGAAMGTRFAVAEESNAADAYKQRIIDCEDGITGTTHSTTWDHLAIVGKGFIDGGYTGRALSDSTALCKYPTVESLAAITKQDIDDYSKADYKTKAVWTGASSGLIDSTTSCSDIISSTIKEAIEILSPSSGSSLRFSVSR
eukprot:TRINITY_DN2216_c0_g1_i1.p1 TRINITY_DN2216_c0_g1~~TRINITY_DN2216_c0_g1_i1.p1  ORF type:complete len:346 (+),score=68.53 TRINITY_DN2216_c0_g1_i1:87-1124(+)